MAFGSGVPGSQGSASGKRYIRYEGFLGLNTKRDPHALDRWQLQQSQNMWNLSDRIIGKRPGNVNFAGGATGSGAACQGMGAARYSNNTYVLVQSNQTAVYYAKPTDVSFTAISTALTTGGTLRTCQMFDPANGAAPGTDTTFVVNGKDLPFMWNGPPATTMANVAHTGGTTLPGNRANSAGITPKYVSTLLGQLFYAGEPTEPGAVYVSDPFFPEKFSFSSTLLSGIIGGGAYGSTYIPYYIGRNDGVNGGDITGIEPMASAMIVYKSSAIYRMDYGMRLIYDTVWSISPVSVSVGATSPRSITRFDTFHCFLGIDGVYQTDGISTRRISDPVPTFFDGPTAAILDRTTAVGVRLGMKYLLFYDDGAGSGSPKGYPTRGMSFDFAKVDQEGYPSCHEILGMNVNGAVELRGPTDASTFVWCNGASDQVGNFGTQDGNNPGTYIYSDFGAVINANFTTKSDWFPEYDPGAPQKRKQFDDVALLLSMPVASIGTALTFNCTFFEDIDVVSTGSGVTVVEPGGGGAIVGTATIPAIIGASAQNSYQRVPVFFPAEVPSAGLATPQLVRGYVIATNVQESSKFGWNVLAVESLVEAHQVESPA